MNTQRIRLDLDKSLAAGQIVVLGQGDKEGTTIEAEVFDNGVSANLAGMTASFRMRLPDGTSYYDESAEVSGNVVSVTVDETYAASVHGYTDDAYFTLTDDERTYSTARFRIKVLRAADDDAVLPEPYINRVEEAIENANEAAEEAEQAVSDATSAIDAANQAIARIEPTIEQAAEDAAEQATADAEQRIQDAIDAVGDISELAVPLMTTDTRGGAKLGDGLAVDDGTLHVGQLAKASTSEVYGPLVSVTAKGHAEQASTTGKNLAVPLATGSNSNYGITWTMLDDGRFSVVGTSTNSSAGKFFENTDKVFGTTLAAGVYVASTTNANVKMRIGIGSSATHLVSVASPYVLNVSESDEYYFRPYVESGVTINDTVGIQLELGSTATPYEPYTGGEPSPSPDYPQEIKVAKGRNLMDELEFRKTYTGTWHSEIVGKVAVEVGKTYVFSNKSGWVSGTHIYLACSDIERSVGFDTNSAATNQLYEAKLASDYAMTGIYQHNDKKSYTFTATGKWFYVIVWWTIYQGEVVVEEPQLTFGSTLQPYVPYGYVGLEVKGRNLWSLASSYSKDAVGDMFARTAMPFDAGTYTLSFKVDSFTSGSNNRVQLLAYDSSVNQAASVFVALANGRVSGTFTANVRIETLKLYAGTACAISDIQLELDSVATQYEPYFHTTTPIPLPERGWVGGLPDGTADSLRLDGAGKCVWELADEETTTAATDGVTGTIGVDVLSTTGQIADDATVLYKLATPVTEECGYVDLPDIPSEATVTIPELEELGLTFWVDGDGNIRAAMRNWYERSHSDMTLTESQVDAAVAAAFA